MSLPVYVQEVVAKLDALQAAERQAQDVNRLLSDDDGQRLIETFDKLASRPQVGRHRPSEIIFDDLSLRVSSKSGGAPRCFTLVGSVRLTKYKEDSLAKIVVEDSMGYTLSFQRGRQAAGFWSLGYVSASSGRRATASRPSGNSYRGQRGVD